MRTRGPNTPATLSLEQTSTGREPNCTPNQNPCGTHRGNPGPCASDHSDSPQLLYSLHNKPPTFHVIQLCIMLKNQNGDFIAAPFMEHIARATSWVGSGECEGDGDSVAALPRLML